MMAWFYIIDVNSGLYYCQQYHEPSQAGDNHCLTDINDFALLLD